MRTLPVRISRMDLRRLARVIRDIGSSTFFGFVAPQTPWPIRETEKAVEPFPQTILRKAGRVKGAKRRVAVKTLDTPGFPKQQHGSGSMAGAGSPAIDGLVNMPEALKLADLVGTAPPPLAAVAAISPARGANGDGVRREGLTAFDREVLGHHKNHLKYRQIANRMAIDANRVADSLRKQGLL